MEVQMVGLSYITLQSVEWKCTLPLPTVPLTAEQAKSMFDSLSVLLQAGFKAQQEGLEEGETKEVVTHLAHRNKANTDGTSTSIIDVYCGGNFKVVGVYLNNEGDSQKFTEALVFLPTVSLFSMVMLQLSAKRMPQEIKNTSFP